MKKIISLILSAIMIISVSTIAVNAKSTVCAYGHGDVNGDGVVSMIDVTNLQKYIASLIDFTSEQKYSADVTGDSSVKMNDVTEIQRYIADLINKFPACDTEGNNSSSDGQISIDGNQFKPGDTFTYKLKLNCDEGDITAINANIKYDNSVISLVDYNFPVITGVSGIDPVVNNNKSNSLFSFTASTVNKAYSGFNFKSNSGKNSVVEIKFKVNETEEYKKSSINFEIKELFRLSDEGYIDFFIDNMRVPGYEKTVNFSYEIVK